MRLVISIICLLLSALASADNVRILAVEEPPSSYMLKDGTLSGYSIEIVRAIQKHIGNTDKITLVPEARAYYNALKKKNTVLIGFSRTPEREELFHWVTLLLRKSWIFYAKRGVHKPINSLDDARQFRTIGVVRGDVRSAFLRERHFTNLIEVADHERTIEMLSRDRLDLLFYEPLGLAYGAKKLGIPLTSFEMIYKANTSDVYLMISKPGTDMATVNQWQQAASTLKDDGTFQTIGERWSEKIHASTGLRYKYKDGALELLESQL